MSEVDNLQKAFGLKKPNFILDPIEDAEFYAPRTGIDLTKLREDLETDLVTGRAPKWLFWGPYGSGKTHTLRKVMKELEKRTPLFPVFVEGRNSFVGQRVLEHLHQHLVGNGGHVRPNCSRLQHVLGMADTRDQHLG